LNDLSQKKIIIISGHYGTGKTNVSVNLALKLKEKYNDISITDLDTVNPYFRTADNEKYLNEKGIKTILPKYANSNVDIPSLPESLFSIFDSEGKAIVDVGGDDDGAAPLGSLKKRIENSGYEMYCVCNFCRQQTSTAEENAYLMAAIERMSGLKFSGLINNTNLSYETTPEIVFESLPKMAELEKLTGLKTVFTTAMSSLAPKLDSIPNIVYIENITKKLY
jgi:hypothetical protein